MVVMDQAADLSGADLAEATNLVQHQIALAKGNSNTSLPAYLKMTDSWEQLKS
jgi:hypothetical protein